MVSFLIEFENLLYPILHMFTYSRANSLNYNKIGLVAMYANEILFVLRYSLTLKCPIQTCKTNSQDMFITGLWHAIVHPYKAI